MMGVMDQVTAALAVPPTVAVNASLPDGAKTTLLGARPTVTGGARLMVAEALLAGAAKLVAVTVTVCAAVMEMGAV